jgi:hypothetical protein
VCVQPKLVTSEMWNMKGFLKHKQDN